MYKTSNNNLLEQYSIAKERVLSFGYEDEINWQGNLSQDLFTESDFLREAAWVILCSGFRESYIRNIFSLFSLCFCDWESANQIVSKVDLCRETSYEVFSNYKKIDAIIKIAEQIDKVGFADFKKIIIEEPINQLKLYLILVL